MPSVHSLHERITAAYISFVAYEITISCNATCVITYINRRLAKRKGREVAGTGTPDPKALGPSKAEIKR